MSNMKIEMIRAEDIRLDGDTQPRATINEAACRDYGERMLAGDRFRPLTVYYDGENYWLADGFHRFYANFLSRPGEPIECQVIEGSLQDAQWHSVGANREHGIRRTNADKEQSVKKALEHPNSRDMSDEAIAQYTGVANKTVARYRKLTLKLSESSGQDTEDSEEPNIPTGVPPWKAEPPPASRSRTGRDGRTINTAKIGRSKPSRLTAKMMKNPVAVAAGMDKMTALSMPHNPETGARTLIEVFDADYLRRVVAVLSEHLNTIAE